MLGQHNNDYYWLFCGPKTKTFKETKYAIHVFATNTQVYCMWPTKPLDNMYNPVVHFSSGEYGVETTKKKTW